MRLEPQTKVPLNNTDGYAYSFWFYDPYATAGDLPSIYQGGFLQGTVGGQNSGMQIDSSTKSLKPRTHGFVNTSDSWYDSSIVDSAGSGFNVNYEPLKLNNFLFLKKNANSMEVWFNGQKVAYNTSTAGYYPDSPFDWVIDSTNACFATIGDLAYWDEDISDIAPDIYNNGVVNNWMNLSKKPKHYYRFANKSNNSKILDEGTDGANHLSHARPDNKNYILASVNGTNNGYIFGAGYFTNVTDPGIAIRVGDPITFRNDTGGHPLAIKDSNDFIVAEEDSVTKKTRWLPTHPGIYRYYCTAHPDTMGADLIVFDKNFTYNNIVTAVQE